MDRQEVKIYLPYDPKDSKQKYTNSSNIKSKAATLNFYSLEYNICNNSKPQKI